MTQPPAMIPKVNVRLMKMYPMEERRNKMAQHSRFMSLYILSQSVILLLVILDFLHHKIKVFKCGDYSKSKKNKKQPWFRLKFFIQEIANQCANSNGNGHRHTHNAEIAQSPKRFPGFVIH